MGFSQAVNAMLIAHRAQKFLIVFIVVWGLRVASLKII
jgi:hypothetical protein